MQNHAQTSSRESGEAKSNCDYGSEKGLESLLFLWRENYGAFRAEVVVFNHPPGSASNPKQVAGPTLPTDPQIRTRSDPRETLCG
jgi:hypothetical protein